MRIHGMTILQLILQVAALYAPAMAANMAPVVARRYNLFSRLNKPIDFGLQWRGERLFGAHKTIRGFVVGVISGAIVGAALSLIIDTHPYDYFSRAILYGAIVGFGALVGDSVKSFFKRRVGIKPGTLWVPFDQIDFAIGATLAAMFFIRIDFFVAACAIIFIGCASYVVSIVGVALHMKKNL